MKLINKHHYNSTNLSIKNLLINLIIDYISLKFIGGFHQRIYHFSLYSLTAVFVSYKNGNI